MDYVVGSVAALITGNVTPNRPRPIKKALTPTKHQPSPNVTPKSELFGDRSIFLSPTLQRRKAIVKKSPKRIFENPDLDLTNDCKGTTGNSPKTDKVKKHLKNVLDAEDSAGINAESQKNYKSPKDKSIMTVSSPKKNKNKSAEIKENKVQVSNETTPKKKKKRRNLTSEPSEDVKTDKEENTTLEDLKTEGVLENINQRRPKKKKQRRSISESTGNMEIETIVGEQEVPAISHENPQSPKKRKKQNIKTPSVIAEFEGLTQSKPITHELTLKLKKKKHNKKSKLQNNEIKDEGSLDLEPEESVNNEAKNKPSINNNNNKKNNPNAITMNDSDSEHESDNEIESETEQINNELLNKEGIEESSDEEDEQKLKKRGKKEDSQKEEVKRTLFVGNVPFSSKCKKEIKNIFSKYGDIQSIRIRTVPVKDARMTPKLAVIKNELHPDRSTVNVYIKFIEASSVHKALVENNTLLNDHHLRVSPSEDTGALHDPKCSVFVGNMPFALEDEALWAIFEKCGEIASVRIIRDKKTNAGKGFGYVNFVSKDGVELALGLSEEDLTIKNRIIRVKRIQTNQNQERDRKFKGGNQACNFQGRNQGAKFQASNQGGNFQGRNQGQNFRGRNPGGNFRGRGHGGNFRERNQGGNFQRGNQDGSVERRNEGGGFRGRNQGSFQGSNRGGGFRGGNRGGFQGRNQGESFQGRNQGGNFQSRNQNKDKRDGDFAFERIMKRKSQESGDGPPDKKVKNLNQPIREKKPRKEFVGMTAEKKKKPKFNKGQKKKKALSEILTK